MTRVDLAVIGAGPAGMAAAATAAGLGIETAVIDEQPGPGGQIYRDVERSPLADRDVLGPEYRRGEALARGLRAQNIDYLSDAAVWLVTPEREIGILKHGSVRMLSAKRIILACGAQERPFPIPGWTLPGVMGAGAGQILLKSGGLVPDGDPVLAGCGPLIWLIAWQYLRAGAKVAAILETGRRQWAALPRLPRALGAPGYLVKGMQLMWDVRRAGVPVVSGVTGLRALGEPRLTAVEYRRGGTWRRRDCDLLLLHQGVVPNVQITQAVGCTHDWDDVQLGWRPRLDSWGNTELSGIAVAGDAGGIVGATASELNGRLAALAAAHDLGRLTKSERDDQARPIRAERDRHLRIRPFLDALYRPDDAFRRPHDDATIVCRCEEVTAGEIREMVALGCQGPNQTKAFTRCGMGPCQGRMCGLTVSELIAEARGVPVADVGHYRIRPPIKPITLGQLAEAAEPDAEEFAS